MSTTTDTPTGQTVRWDISRAPRRTEHSWTELDEQCAREGIAIRHLHRLRPERAGRRGGRKHV